VHGLFIPATPDPNTIGYHGLAATEPFTVRADDAAGTRLAPERLVDPRVP
jgi:hypothetical protein